MTFDPNLIHLLLLALATFRLTRLIIEDQIFEPVRNRIWAKYPPTTQIGYLFTCPWCVSIWAGSLLTAGYILIPTITLAIALVLSLSAAVGLLYTWLDDK